MQGLSRLVLLRRGLVCSGSLSRGLLLSRADAIRPPVPLSERDVQQRDGSEQRQSVHALHSRELLRLPWSDRPDWSLRRRVLLRRRVVGRDAAGVGQGVDRELYRRQLCGGGERHS